MDNQFKPKLAALKLPAQIGPDQKSLATAEPSALSEKVKHALEQRVEREQMGMVPSLSKVQAQNGLQASLDIFRAHQMVRVGTEVRDMVIEAIARDNEKTEQSIATHPELEAEIREIDNGLREMYKRLPRTAAVGYYRRYHQLGNDRPDDYP